MKENIQYICRPTPSDDLRYISRKSNKKEAIRGKKKHLSIKNVHTIHFNSSAAIYI